jgi:RNA polymerase sigma-70 factor, ECF subfamily
MESASVEHCDLTAPPKPFPEVYRAYLGFVWRTLGKMHVRDADLLDMTQNVFVIVHRQLPGFEGRSELTTWLYTICRRVARDYRRSAPLRREVLVDVCEAPHGALRDDEADRLDSQELSQLLHSILIQIPEKLREVFVLFELDELSGEEIARLLDIPVGTVRSRLRLARAAFQRHVRSLKVEPEVAVSACACGDAGVLRLRARGPAVRAHGKAARNAPAPPAADRYA